MVTQYQFKTWTGVSSTSQLAIRGSAVPLQQKFASIGLALPIQTTTRDQD